VPNTVPLPGNGCTRRLSASAPNRPWLPWLTTTRWRDPVLNRPEAELLGLQYHSLIARHTLPRWWVQIGPLDPLEEAAGLMPGEQLSGGILGYVYDGSGGAHTPANLVILAASLVPTRYGSRRRGPVMIP